MAQHSHHDQGAHARETLANPLKAHVTPHHEPGTMDITAQQETFVTFLRFTMRMTIVILVLLVLLAIFNG